ncbi:MAG TPA: molybdate ABC transporter substrate-binding protein [Acidimicrobiales bacterium]|nr:molybdate ABC transporter substrate-binding protein [Acidimicrobiales bacterium]
MVPSTPALRRPIAVLAVLLLLLGAAACSDDSPDGAGSTGGEEISGTVTVFAAASLTDVFTALGQAFEEAHPEATVELGFGPSSGLVTQVTEGAPADVIATAAEPDMEDLVDADVLAGAPVPFATNRLEIAVPPGNPAGVDGLDDLADEDLVVALCNEEVPCGRFARQALEGVAVEPSIDSDEEDVRALLTKVEAGEVDVGIVYETDVVAAGDAVEGIAIPADQNVTATYPIATVGDTDHAAGAAAFVAFVLSDEGRVALAAAGFGAPPGAG